MSMSSTLGGKRRYPTLLYSFLWLSGFVADLFPIDLFCVSNRNNREAIGEFKVGAIRDSGPDPSDRYRPRRDVSQRDRSRDRGGDRSRRDRKRSRSPSRSRSRERRRGRDRDRDRSDRHRSRDRERKSSRDYRDRR